MFTEGSVPYLLSLLSTPREMSIEVPICRYGPTVSYVITINNKDNKFPTSYVHIYIAYSEPADVKSFIHKGAGTPANKWGCSKTNTA